MFEALTNFFNTVMMILNNYGGLLAKGTGVTILLAIVGTGVGFLIGLLIGVYKTLPIREDDSTLKKVLYKVFSFLLSAYIEVFRSTPMMVQAMLFYYGIAMVFNIQLNIFFFPFVGLHVSTKYLHCPYLSPPARFHRHTTNCSNPPPHTLYSR